ncbi:unnamed protein product [Pedinophyceae sp. YPF-701]|nr:unnamed protein product [Pedinophyceae sp. YPF-701]
MSWRKKPAKDIRVLVVGSTGYIGRFVTKEMMARGFDTVAVAREKSGVKGKKSKEDVLEDFKGATVAFADCTSAESLRSALAGQQFDVVVSCLASRTGGIEDSNLIDYQATRHAMDVGQELGAKHFVLLSAICVQKPTLEFQRAKLKFEAELQANEDMTHSIVRPTAFFKSLGGQVELVKNGSPYVMFGDGTLAACKPISERDLASYMADCVLDKEGSLTNQVLPIGGPGRALTALDQAIILFRLVGRRPEFIQVPIQVMDGVIWVFDKLAAKIPQLADAAEFGKIGRYYAAESMLVMDPKTGVYDPDSTPSYGKDTLEDFFKRVLEEGMAGQELGDQAVFGVAAEAKN